jgi:hypothetical protein
MKKTVLATIAIWFAGIGSAAALVTTLARPPKPMAHEEMSQPEPAPPEPPPNIDHFKVPKPLDALSPAKVRAQIKVPFKRKTKEMRCSSPHSMQMGEIDRSVRYCQ